MAIALTCNDVVRSGNLYYVRWSDKVEQEFSNIQQVRDYINAVRDDGSGKEVLRALALAKWLQADAGGVTPSLLIGKTITLDLTLASNIVRVT